MKIVIKSPKKFGTTNPLEECTPSGFGKGCSSEVPDTRNL